jgi:hypothetical protein
LQLVNSDSSADSFGLQQKIAASLQMFENEKIALKFLKFKALNAKSTGVFTGVFQPNF